MSKKKLTAIERTRALIEEESFKERHRKNANAFTRSRKLGFSKTLLFIMRKSIKSIQLGLNEMSLIYETQPVSTSAFTQARANLSHTAFIELNKKAVVDVMYSDNQIKRYKGMRVLAVDGSKITLPKTPSTLQAFDEIQYSNQYGDVKRKYCTGVASVIYDVLNNIVISSSLSHSKAYEVNLAIEHLNYTKKGDLLIFDRNYPSYIFLSHLISKKINFVIRCSQKSFKQARNMLKGLGESDQSVLLTPHYGKRKEVRKNNLPEQLNVRFVRVKLQTGEYEVLITNLLNKKNFPRSSFKYIYYMRWGVEGLYYILKSRLNLENFTGKTTESIYQDFYAAVYLIGLESILTLNSNKILARKKAEFPQKVNRTISFNAIKNQLFKLLSLKLNYSICINQLENLFLTTPTIVRKHRSPPRIKHRSRTTLAFTKRVLKYCF